MSSILDIFQQQPSPPIKKDPKELNPELPIFTDENPIDIEMPTVEVDEMIDVSDMIDYGIYNLREHSDADFIFKSGVLQNTPMIGVPINAFRVLLGKYSFEYGAKDHISSSLKHVIVRFPVAFRSGSIKQTTGSDDVDYEWSGHIKTPNVHEDLKAIREIVDAGEPVDFFYLGRKKKVLLEEFDYKILDNCNANYDIKVTEYYPQKIKFIPVRVDPLIPDRWGNLRPPTDDEKDKDKCNCFPTIKLTKERRVKSRKYFASPWGQRPDGINPTELHGEFRGLSSWFNRTFAFLALSVNNDIIFKNIIDYATWLFYENLRTRGKMNCLKHLFIECPHLQDEFYKDLVMWYLINGIYLTINVEDGDVLHVNLFHYNEEGRVTGGNDNLKEKNDGIENWFLLNTNASILEVMTKLSNYKDFPCADLFDEFTGTTPDYNRAMVDTLCKTFRRNLNRLKEQKERGFPDMSTNKINLQTILSSSFDITFFLPEVVFGEGCDRFCDMHDDELIGGSRGIAGGTGGRSSPGGGEGGGGSGGGFSP